MKRFLLYIIPLFLLLCGCASLPPPDEAQIAQDLTAYYQTREYRIDGSVQSLSALDAPEILEITADQWKKTAYVRCRARIVSDGGNFARSDLWTLWYTYDRANACWTPDESDRAETAYELLADLTQEQCLLLMPIPDGQSITLESVTTDRVSKTASAIYSYQTTTAQFGAFGSLTLNAVVQADFVWSIDGGWQYAGSAFTDATHYTGELGCYIGDDESDIDKESRVSIGFDLIVIGDMVCIEHLRYRGEALAAGTLHIGKTALTAANDGQAAVITFSYVRETENGEKFSGDGRITISAGPGAGYYAGLFLDDFITDSNGKAVDLTRRSIPLEATRGIPEPPAEAQPEPPQEPDESEKPEPPQENEEPIVEQPAKSPVGTWVCLVPEELGTRMEITALLREDLSCEVVCKAGFAKLRRESTYYIVEELTQLPTDLLALVLSGQTPTVGVVYDAESDRLYTCLQEGLFVYFTREESGEVGGIVN